MRNNLHNAVCLLLEREDGRLLVVKILIFNPSHCPLHIVEVKFEASLHVSVDGNLNLVMYLFNLLEVWVYHDVTDQSA